MALHLLHGVCIRKLPVKGSAGSEVLSISALHRPDTGLLLRDLNSVSRVVIGIDGKYAELWVGFPDYVS